MKPIEPGCLAIIIGEKYKNGNIGKSVLVLKKSAPDDIDWKDGKAIGPNHWDVEIKSEGVWVCHEKHLIRIDDYDPSTEETTSDREVTV